MTPGDAAPLPAVLLRGRVLYLTEDASLLSRQLAGEDLPFSPSDPAHRLRDDVSTDEITPGWVCFHRDEALGRFAYVGLTCRGPSGERKPVGEGAVLSGGFVASVAGRRRGKGSSREQAPYAERAAGIRLVVAESVERIYRQNCVNLGLLVTEDFSVLDRVARGEPVPLEAFLAGADPITREVVRRGGLFPYNRARLRGETCPPPVTTPPRPMTLAEKVLASRWVTDAVAGTRGVAAVAPGDAGFVETDLRFSHEYVTPMAAALFDAELGPDAPVADPGSVLLFRDHLTFLGEVMPAEHRARGLLTLADALPRIQEEFARRKGIRLLGELPPADGRASGSEAICHSEVLDAHALPGQVVVGSDSHTPQAGAVGCLAFGIGTSEVASALFTRDVRVTVPPSVKVELSGRLAPGVTAKDAMLALLAHPFVKGGGAIGAVLEYHGEGLLGLGVGERATLTNMAAEAGAFSAVVPPDARTERFLVSARDLDPEAARALCERWRPDPEATYTSTLALDLCSLSPMVALPGDPGNGVRLDDLPGPVPVDIAYGGSCTGGKRSDMDMYAAVLADGLARGRRVAAGVTFYIQFGSQRTRAHCRERGYLEIFEAAGVLTIEPGCGACIAAGPGVSTREEQVTVSAVNRNFPGRSGPGRVYLASPYVVAASALAGRLARFEPSVDGVPGRG